MENLTYRQQVNLDIRQITPENNEQKDRKYYRARISSDQLDSHYSTMDISTLANFADEAAKGVAVLDSHNHRTVGIGRSVSGELIEGEVFSDFYILKDLELNNQSFRNSNSFIKAVDSKMLQDVSVGFYGHKERCNTCGKDLWGGECTHWPGLDYEVGEEGDKRIETCTTTIIDGHLSEFSLVYDGALEGAEIVDMTEKIKAKAERTASKLNTRQKQHVTDTYKFDFDGIKRSGDSPQDPPKKKSSDDLKKKPETSSGQNKINKIRSTSMSKQTSEERIAKLEADIELHKKRADEATEAAKGFYEVSAERDQLERMFNDESSTVETLRALHTTQKKEIEKQDAELKELRPKAERYDAHMERIVKDALLVYTQASGNVEGHEKYEAMKAVLETYTDETMVEAQVEMWQPAADERFPGGSQLGDENKDEDKPPETDNLPDANAY